MKRYTVEVIKDRTGLAQWAVFDNTENKVVERTGLYIDGLVRAEALAEQLNKEGEND